MENFKRTIYQIWAKKTITLQRFKTDKTFVAFAQAIGLIYVGGTIIKIAWNLLYRFVYLGQPPITSAEAVIYVAACLDAIYLTEELYNKE